MALAFPEILYQGFGNVNALLELKSDVYAPLLLLQMLAAKVVVTAICRGSGLVGGIYAPSIFMGTPQVGGSTGKSYEFSSLCIISRERQFEGVVRVQSAFAEPDNPRDAISARSVVCCVTVVGSCATLQISNH